ncbi:MAG: hypothetical protein SF162_09800 [bacterium]|nr:hypothetical protein [bacterium]
MLRIVYHPADEAARGTAARLLAALPADDLTRTPAPTQTRDDVLIAVISAASNAETGGIVEQAYVRALDQGQYIIPVIVGGTGIPKLIDHLPYVDFTQGDDLAGVRALIDQYAQPGAKTPLKVRTPAVRKANAQFGWIVGVAAVVMFALGIYGVGVLGIQRPNEEFEEIDQQVTQTIQALLAPPLATMEGYLPQNPDQAYIYPATLLAAPTRYRPFIAGTATIRATVSGIYAATPTPEPTPGS